MEPIVAKYVSNVRSAGSNAEFTKFAKDSGQSPSVIASEAQDDIGASCSFIMFRHKIRVLNGLTDDYKLERSFWMKWAAWRSAVAMMSGQSFSSFKFEYGKTIITSRRDNSD